MTRLLRIDASPRGAQSHSRRAADEFIAQLAALQPALEVDQLSVWEEDLPPFDGAALSAKYARLSGRAHSDAEARAWTRIEQLVARLACADRILIATPMWNMSVPYRLKHLLDLVIQPGLTFSFDPARGYAPLLVSKPVLAIVASSGDFSSGESWGRPDLATPYLREALAFIGLRDTHFVALGPAAGDARRIQLRAQAARFANAGSAA